MLIQEVFLGALDSVVRQLDWVLPEDAWYMLSQWKDVCMPAVFMTDGWN